MLRHATLVFLLDGAYIILAKKKKRFWEGRYNGYGGRVEKDEEPIEAAVRETREESTVIVDPRDLEKVARITIHNKGDDSWLMTVYVTRKWIGTPQETEEMGPPEWFLPTELPKDKLPVGDYEWLHLVLAGRRGRATLHRSADKQRVTGFKWEDKPLS